MSALKKLAWYRHRIAAMSAPEIMHRALEVAKKKHDRRRSHIFIPTATDHGPLPPIPGLREGLRDWQVPNALAARWETHTAEAQSGRFFLLGQRWPECPAHLRWHLDPVTGKSWPHDRFCFAIDYRHAADMGDVKYVWELNRLQYLQPVAALAFLRQDRALAEFALSGIESWIDHNPPHQGVHWASGIELALRAVSILAITSLIGEHLTAAQHKKIWGTLEAHALWLERYPSKYSSANNHRTAEGLGLFVIGALCTSLKGAKRWKAHGWELLCETARLQILPDGVGAEQTPNYTAVVLEMLLLGLHIARAQGMEIPAYYPERIALAGEWLRWLTDEGGNQPRIGDDDNARVIGAYHHDETYVRSILGCIAATTERADLTPPCQGPNLRNALFGFPPPKGVPPEGIRTFADGGYTVGRHEADGQRIMLAMDHGYLGYLSIAAHGHADALAIWLHIGGQPVLVDAGTYLYHSGGTWRNYFRGTAAHNTLCLEKTDSSILSGHFNWSHKASARLDTFEATPEHWLAEAEHDGYRKRFGVIHRRRLNVIPATGFTVEDWLAGGGAYHTDIGYLIHPSLTIRQNGESLDICKGEQAILRLSHEGPLETRIEKGWYSPTFGEKLPATRIVFSGALAAEQKAVTRFSWAGIV